ncbi:MAG: hypothetical protein KC492_25815 [Myxococcales bacterium]|nr:hypothetical protein [Myxococcales bacterium]
MAPDATDECVVDASVRALLGRGSARRELGESALARTDFEEALQIATRVAEPGLAAVALTKLGELDDVASDTVRARARLDDAMKLLAQTPANDVRKQREAQVLRHLGHAHRREGALAPAVESLSESSMRFRELGCETERTAVLYELAVVQIFASRTREALNLVDEGLEIARRCDTPGMEALLLLARGSALQEMDDLDGAGADYARAAQIFADHGDRHREASALYYLGTTHLEREEPQNALAVLGQARRRIAPVGSPRYEALISAGMAGSHAALQRYGEAKQELRRAEEALSHVSHEPALSAAVAIHRSCLELASGDIAADQRPTAVAEANALVRRNPNDDSRFALRRLLVFASGGRNPEPRALVVRSDGGGFTLPGGNAVALPARSPQRLILLCLATRRVAAPGEVVSTDELIAAGWPDEQILSHAAINRLYVAVTTLRRRGLKDLLLSGGGGYLLSPAVVVRLETN